MFFLFSFQFTGGLSNFHRLSFECLGVNLDSDFSGTGFDGFRYPLYLVVRTKRILSHHADVVFRRVFKGSGGRSKRFVCVCSR